MADLHGSGHPLFDRGMGQMVLQQCIKQALNQYRGPAPLPQFPSTRKKPLPRWWISALLFAARELPFMVFFSVEDRSTEYVLHLTAKPRFGPRGWFYSRQEHYGRDLGNPWRAHYLKGHYSNLNKMICGVKLEIAALRAYRETLRHWK